MITAARLANARTAYVVPHDNADAEITAILERDDEWRLAAAAQGVTEADAEAMWYFWCRTTGLNVDCMRRLLAEWDARRPPRTPQSVSPDGAAPTGDVSDAALLQARDAFVSAYANDPGELAGSGGLAGLRAALPFLVRERPVVVTDEMVDRCARAFIAGRCEYDPGYADWDSMWRSTAVPATLAGMRAALTAAFGTGEQAPAAMPREPYQTRTNEWMIQCFGTEITGDRVERNHRFLEEAVELVQSGGCTRSEAHQLVDYVFDRDVGDLKQEVGGVMVTLAAFCNAHKVDLNECAEAELARCWTKTEKIRAKQAAKPKHSPLPEHVAQPPDPLSDPRVRRLVEAATVFCFAPPLGT